MTTLHSILSAHDGIKHATAHGTKTHARLQHVEIDGENIRGDGDLIKSIRANPALLPFFGPNSKSEVPIAGTINNRFVSRRIDRLVVDHATKAIKILDYKTDTERTTFHDKYVVQLREYATLLRAIYPDYTITAHILWTYDFSLENIPVKQL